MSISNYKKLPQQERVDDGRTETLSNYFGLDVIGTLSRDGYLLLLCKSVRMFSFGFLAVMLVSFFLLLLLLSLQGDLSYAIRLLRVGSWIIIYFNITW